MVQKVYQKKPNKKLEKKLLKRGRIQKNLDLEENNQEGFKIFDKFTEERIKGDGVTLFVRRGGPKDAPPNF